MEFPASFDLRSVDTDGDGIGDRCYVTPVRAQYPAAVPGYYEVGDTAYLTLDNFSYMFGADHYALTETDELPIDTFGQASARTGRSPGKTAPSKTWCWI